LGGTALCAKVVAHPRMKKAAAIGNNDLTFRPSSMSFENFMA
jgi:hypothetical protein